MIDYEELSKMYSKVDKIGEGTYGVVYKVKDVASNELKAMKKIKSDNDFEGTNSTTIREICILKSLKHLNIVLLEKIFFL